MKNELMEVLEAIGKEKAISKDVIIDAIESALISAYKKNYPDSNNVEVNIDRVTGNIKIYNKLLVVDEYSGDGDEILLEEALLIDKNYQLGDVIKEEINTKNFGRIAAQTAKQVVVSKIREAEKNAVLSEYENRESEIINTLVHRVDEKGNIYIELGKIEGIIFKSEQLVNDSYKAGDNIKAYILSVKSSSKGSEILLSRTATGFVERLFESQVPEIYEGIIRIKSISREAGYRTKLAVYTENENIDAIGACIGPRGERIQKIVEELKGEKIDIINYSDDPAKYIENALSPSTVLEIKISDNEKSALAIVPDNQLSLAIGKEGQNARLAAKLTGWKIDIKSESQAKEIFSNEK